MAKNPIPQGKYKPAVRYGDFIVTAGMTPRKDGVLILSGKIRADQPLESYKEAVIQAASNALVAAENCLAEGEGLAQVMAMTVYVNAEADFTTHPKIGDFASEYLCEQLGDAGSCARAAVGVATLPGNAPVEIQLMVMAGRSE